MDTGLGGCSEFTAMGLMFLVSHRRFAGSPRLVKEAVFLQA